MQVCPSCGAQNDRTARFCPQCGAALTSAPAARREERKVVTVVFADLVGSTARAEKLDPEDVRAILSPYHERLRDELERRGGTVEKFIGDAVVGVFGAPVAHEDDAERAVRTALAIQAAIAELNEADAALELEVRIGVNTGEALVSVDARPEAGEAMVAGDVINTAARLQAAAPPGGVLVGDATYRTTSRAIEYEAVEPIAAKGKAEPVAAWLALSPRARFGVDVFQTGRAALVGRERELELLAAALARAREEKEPQFVTLVGVPGIGKSRLVYELSRIVDDDPELIVWRQGRSLPYDEGVAFWAVGEIVKAQAGILESEGAHEAETKLSAAIADLLPEEHEAQWVERHVRPLVGLAGETEAGEVAQAEAFAAWRRLFEALAESGPAVLVFEDLQWADDGLLEFVDGLAERVAGVPLLVVCSTRPELLERRSDWGGGKRNALTISLAPLSEADTARLLADLLDRPVLPAEEQAILLQRAGGNPLYAEEYARMLEAGPSVEGVPETLQGVVVARIDGLPSEEKELLQQASVLGKVFWTDALHAAFDIEPWLLEERLHSLERKEFVRREHRSAVAGAKQYVFVHALVRDGAYGQMPRAARANAHELVADWIDSLPADRAEDRAEMLAHHLLQAVEYKRAAGLDVAGLAPRAAGAMRDAGDRAWRMGAPGTALSFYEQARTQHPGAADDPYFVLRLGRAMAAMDYRRGAEELELVAAALAESDPAAAAEAVMALGEIVWQRGDHEGAFAYIDRAAAVIEPLPASREKLVVVGHVARFLTLEGRSAEGLARAEQAIGMAEALGEDEILSDLLNTRGLARVALGDRDGVADVESSLALSLERGSWRAGRSYLNLGSLLLAVAGEVARSDAITRKGLEFAESRGFRLVRWYYGNLAESAFHLGGWVEALERIDYELADPEPHYMRPQCQTLRAHMRLVRDDVAGAVGDARRGAEESRAIVDPQAYVPGVTTQAFVAARTGDLEEASATIDELRARLDELGQSGGQVGPWVVELALALLELGREAELLGGTFELGHSTPWVEAALEIARGRLAEAAELLHATGSVAYESYVRLVAARSLSAEGRHAEAERHLTPALAFYRSVGATAAIREGESLLAAAS